MMTTVGELLKSARVKKNLDFEAIEKVTKIRAKFLQALEENEFDKLPPGTFTKGLIKNYASYLGLPQDETLAFYRRQVNEEKTPVSFKTPLRVGKISLTPRFFTLAGVSLLLVLFFGYLIFVYFQFAGAPNLLVMSPENNLVVTDDQVEVTGKTDPEANLTINNQPVNLKEDGSFEVKIGLTPGLNSLSIVSTNKFKRQTTKVLNLRLQE